MLYACIQGEGGVEERNKYAVAILRRVKQKMDGRDRIDSFGIPGGGSAGGLSGGAATKMTVQVCPLFSLSFLTPL